MALTAPNVAMMGYTLCEECATPVLDTIAYKTAGLCPEHFRLRANEHLDAAMTVIAGREKLVLRPARRHRTVGERVQRKRGKKRAKLTARAKARQAKINRAQQQALRRLRHLFPELFEVLLADERAKLGLEAWTIERSLTPGTASSSFALLERYCHIGAPDNRGAADQR